MTDVDGEQPPETLTTDDYVPGEAGFSLSSDETESVGAPADYTPETVEFEFPTLLKPKVAIVGFAAGHAHKAPFSDDNVEKWGINLLWKILPDRRWDRWFELHSLYEFYLAIPGHQDFLRTFQGPVYVRESDYALALEWGITTAQPFPHRVLLEQFRPYFNNTISWLLALAIMMRPEWVGMYGVDMAQDHLLQAEYCVAPETRVLTSDLRYVPADTVKIGDRLAAFDEYPPEGETYRQWRTATVTSVGNLIRPSYRMILSDGTKLVSSQEHRWMSMGSSTQRWSETRHLQAPADNPDRQSNLVKVVDVWDTDRTYDGGYLAAAFDGEGWITQTRRDNRSGNHGWQNRIGFAQRPNVMSDAVEAALSNRGYQWASNPQNHGDTNTYTIQGGRSELMRLLGSVRPNRLLDQFDVGNMGQFTANEIVKVVEKEYIGETPVVAIGTDRGTFIAEGIASHNSEQRPSCEYFCGIIEAMGIDLVIPGGSDLLKATHLYGYEDSGPVLEKMQSRFVELGNNLEQLRAQAQQLDQQKSVLEGTMSQMEGARQEVSYWRKNWLTLPSKEGTT